MAPATQKKATKKHTASSKVQFDTGAAFRNAPFDSVFNNVFGDIFSKNRTHEQAASCEDDAAPFNALLDLQSVCFRIDVVATHVMDLILAQSPQSQRAINMLNEISLLAKDGMTRIELTGV